MALPRTLDQLETLIALSDGKSGEEVASAALWWMGQDQVLRNPQFTPFVLEVYSRIILEDVDGLIEGVLRPLAKHPNLLRTLLPEIEIRHSVETNPLIQDRIRIALKGIHPIGDLPILQDPTF